MTDYSLNAEPGRYEITGSPLEMTVTRSAESWQFFAFIFGALLATAFAFIDELPAVRWRIGLKIPALVLTRPRTAAPRRGADESAHVPRGIRSCRPAR
jgi:hypothetical protein